MMGRRCAVLAGIALIGCGGAHSGGAASGTSATGATSASTTTSATECGSSACSSSSSGAATATSTPSPSAAPTVTPVVGSPTPAPAPTLTAAVLPRSTSDRADEQSGYQVHVVYAVPSDGLDRRRDQDGEIQRSVSAWESFLASQANGSGIRVDTAQNGGLDVTFVRLPKIDAAIAARGVYVRDELESELAGLGFNRRDKLYAVYYDGGSDAACGGGAYPPELPGHVAAVYLQGTPPGAPPCDTNPVGADPLSPGYVDYSVLHEVLHTLGFVAACAPDHTEIDGAADGHVGNDPQDLMYRGPADWNPTHMDPSHRDYYGNGASGCLDLAASAFMTPLPPGAQPPPAW